MARRMKHLVVAHAVEIARIDPGDSRINRGLNGCDTSIRPDGPYISDIAIQPRSHL